MEVGHPGGEGVCDQYSLRLMVMVGEAFHNGVMFGVFFWVTGDKAGVV